METFFGRYRNLMVLAAILFAQIIGLAVQVRRPTQLGETRLIRLWAISAVTPFEKAAIHTQKFVQDAWKNYAYLRGVRRENRDLRAELDRMKIEQARLSEDARMAQRVQALLAFKEQYVDTTVAAQVIGTSGSEQSRVLYIDKGSREGIKTDMAVITPTGIVGKIVQVFPEASQVLPVNDQFSGVGVTLKDSRLQGILKGSQNGATTVQYIMADEKVTPGEDVITSGGDRIFPKGLPVGKVVSVEPGKDLFLNIRVIPAARLDELEEVLVVTDIKEKMPEAKDLAPLRASDILADRLPTVPNKPGPGTAMTAGAKPTAGTSSAGAAKPGAANGTRPAGTTAQPANNNSTGPAVQPRKTAPAASAPGTTGTQTGNGTASTPVLKQTKPAPERKPAANPDQPTAQPSAQPPRP